MIFILLALLAGLAWTLWLILQLELWVPLVVSGALGLTALGVFLYRWLRARRAALALERAIAEQGRQQAMNARPEMRAEIQALQKQIQDGIAALKASTLGGRRRGTAALYSLPWYAIIGPPGAGKTTAIKASGLNFPFADGSIRGVGGTRNCDWWFTNDAILLDTAGRYATEQQDQSEWLAFLDMLRKHRGDKPLNGLIVAVSITDVLDASDGAVEAMGKKLRARIDEVMTKLGMVLPVYFVVTKCDLIAGFNEFFADMRKSDRAQAWGVTIPLAADKSQPGAIFAREIDLLVREVYCRAIRRLATERNRQAREAIYQFPLELAGIKRNLHELVDQVFMVNAFQGTPVFRGIYFTSGTQEGAPMGRVLQRMGQAMGIYAPQIAQQQRVESKSYFLHDVFTRVMFPDANIAARSASELRRQRLVRGAVSVAALAVAVAFVIPSVVSFFENRALVASAEKRAKEVEAVDWASAEPIGRKLDKLEPVRKLLVELDGYRDEGPPLEKRFLMYMGEEMRGPLVHVYLAHMQQAFVVPVKLHLEEKLRQISGTGREYARERLLLKQYLMLSDVEHLDVDWATGRYTALWAELNRSTSDLEMAKLKTVMMPLVRYYFELVKPDGRGRARAKPVPANESIVEHARAQLAKVPVRERYYAMFVESIEHELNDEAGDAVRVNLRYPPESLDAMFTDRPEMLAWIGSKQKAAGGEYLKVTGAYTDKGHYAVLANIQEAAALLAREQWVVPLTAEERGDRVAANIAQLANDYDDRYIAAWKGFLADVQVKAPATLKEAVELYGLLRQAPLPYLTILRKLEDHTQWKKSLSQLEANPALTGLANRRLESAITSRTGLRVDVDVKKIAGKVSAVPARFKKTVAFGVPQEGAKGAIATTPLDIYVESLGKLREKMLQALEKNPNAAPSTVALDLANASRDAEALLEPLDQVAKDALLPFLQRPLAVGRY